MPTRRRIAHRTGMSVAACCLVLGAVAGMPTAVADPTATLPPMTSTGGGSIIGGGSNAAISQQLTGLGNPNVQEVDGSDAAQFITADAVDLNPQVAGPLPVLQPE